MWVNLSFIRPSVFWLSDEAIRRGTRMRGTGIVVATGNEFTVSLEPAVFVSGVVVHADGRPAAGAHVGAIGRGYAKSYVQGGQCDAAGALKLALQSGLYYVFRAYQGTKRTREFTRVVVADRPLAPLKIVLQPARRIYGTLTRGPEKRPAANEPVTLYWLDDQSYNKLPPEERLPNPSNDSAPIALKVSSHVQTDGQGRFEFLVAPGRYYLLSPEKMRRLSLLEADLSVLPQVDVTDQAEARIDVHSDDP
jgi:hypothetical protein